jgi:lantibiotic biosynthesis protein
MRTSRGQSPAAGGPQRTWRPILEGALADQALIAVDAIADELSDLDPALVDWSLGGGSAGIAIFFHYLDRVRSDPARSNAADRHISAAIDAVAGGSMTASLFGGVAGVGWAIEHLAAAEGGSGDANEDLDHVLGEILDCPRWTGQYDLVSGLVGFGVYALERLPRPEALPVLRLVLAHLESTARREPDGTTWFTPPELLLPLVDAPRGFYNLGVAHGIPGVLALLGRMTAAAVDPVRSRSLLRAALPWLLSRRLPESPGARFPVCIEEVVEPAPARSAWCYGDPGVAAALLVAADGAGDAELRDLATALAVDAARRPPAACGVSGAGLCHGAAGLGHLFNRLHQSTGDASLRTAARYWLARALDEPRPALADPSTSRGAGWQSHAGILEGAAGVALALLAAASEVAPDWDRMLLISG